MLKLYRVNNLHVIDLSKLVLCKLSFVSQQRTGTLFETQDGVRVFVGRFRTAIIMLQLDELQLIFTSYHSQLICPLAVIVIIRYRCKKPEKI